MKELKTGEIILNLLEEIFHKKINASTANNSIIPWSLAVFEEVHLIVIVTVPCLSPPALEQQFVSAAGSSTVNT